MTKNDERTILVTGATGTVGSEVVKQLLAASSSSSSSGQGVIRAAVHSQNKADKFKRDNKTVDIVNIDYNKPETIADALNHVNKLFLVTVHSPNIVAAEISSSLIKEAKKNGGVKYIVKLSVMGADAEPATTIGRLHRQEEKVIEESGIPHTFLRPTSFMQNFVNIYGPGIKSKNAFYMPGGDAKVSFVDVRDIASVAARVLLTERDDDDSGRRHIGKAYNITGPEALSYYQAAEILSGATGKKISYVNISEADARRVMKDTGLDEWFINITLEQADNYRKGYASQLSDAVESITGNKPISFVQFAKDYAGAFS